MRSKFLLVALFVFGAFSIGYSVESQKDKVEQMLGERNKAAQNYIDALLNLDDKASYAKYDTVINMANDIKAQDELLFNEYKVLIDSLNNKIQAVDKVQSDLESAKAGQGKNDILNLSLMIGAGLFFVLFILFAILFVNKNTRLKKAALKNALLMQKEEEYDSRVASIQSDLDSYREVNEKKSRELRSLLDVETEKVKAAESQLLLINEKAKQDLATAQVKIDQLELFANQQAKKINELQNAKPEPVVDNRLDEVSKEAEALKAECSLLNKQIDEYQQRLTQMEAKEVELVSQFDKLKKQAEQEAIVISQVADAEQKQELSEQNKSHIEALDAMKKELEETRMELAKEKETRQMYDTELQSLFKELQGRR